MLLMRPLPRVRFRNSYGWLNDYVYVGTLDSLRPNRNAVVIRVFRVV